MINKNNSNIKNINKKIRFKIDLLEKIVAL